jgi:hypothetical protein
VILILNFMVIEISRVQRTYPAELPTRDKGIPKASTSGNLTGKRSVELRNSSRRVIAWFGIWFGQTVSLRWAGYGNARQTTHLDLASNRQFWGEFIGVAPIAVLILLNIVSQLSLASRSRNGMGSFP